MLRKPVRISKGLLALATLTAVCLLGTPQSARATLALAWAEDGGARTTVVSVPSFTPGSFSGTVGDFTVTLFGGSATNGASLSSLLSSAVSVTNNSSAQHTLHLWVTETDYTLPTSPPPLIVESGLGGTVNPGTVGLSGIFQAWADRNNNLFGTGDFTNGPQNGTQTGTTFDTGSATGTFTRLATSYSLTSEANFTLSGGATVNYSDHVNVTAVPEPATIATAVCGLPILGLFWTRRRRQRA
jgi:hypothetical protein